MGKKKQKSKSTFKKSSFKSSSTQSKNSDMDTDRKISNIISDNISKKSLINQVKKLIFFISIQNHYNYYQTNIWFCFFLKKLNVKFKTLLSKYNDTNSFFLQESLCILTENDYQEIKEYLEELKLLDHHHHHQHKSSSSTISLVKANTTNDTTTTNNNGNSIHASAVAKQSNSKSKEDLERQLQEEEQIVNHLTNEENDDDEEEDEEEKKSVYNDEKEEEMASEECEMIIRSQNGQIIIEPYIFLFFYILIKI